MVYFVYAIIGMSLFTGEEVYALFAASASSTASPLHPYSPRPLGIRRGPQYYLNADAHFENFGTALITLIRCSTGENWNGIM